MLIQLQQLISVPLKEKILARGSQVWGQNLNINPSQFVKIKAPSGTGKTTLAHILYKLRTDYEGLVEYEGQLLKSFTSNDLSHLRQQKISIIFQDMRLFENLTARENIELKRVMTTPKYDEKIIEEMASQLGIVHVLGQLTSTCSYGEQQRIAIIRALMQPFEWLIMDEPFSHLDEANILKAAKLISNECKKRNAGFLLLDLDEDEHFEYDIKMDL